MITIPDYLIIDEIRRREERSWQPETIQLPLPTYDMPDDDMEKPSSKKQHGNGTPSRKKNGAIIIDMNTNQYL